MKATTKAVIIVNLGSPESPSVSDVKRYLQEFLMDERVIDIHPIFRKILVNGVIIPLRSARSAKAYQSIWAKNGSPLKVITEQFRQLVESDLEMPISYCMRYGMPTPEHSIKELQSKLPELNEIFIAPMYPHYAMSSYESALEYVKKTVKSVNKNIKIRVLKPFYNEPAYISALVSSIQPFLDNNDYDGVMFSYHGLPVRHLKKSDPTKNHCYVENNCCDISSEAWKYCYKHQVTVTTNLVAEKLKLQSNKVILSFQSRIGKGWMQPYTDIMFKTLPAKGIKKILIVCPAFVSDCLETLEEINIRGQKLFLESGGEKFDVVPCLNTSPEWIAAFAAYCNQADNKYSVLWSK